MTPAISKLPSRMTLKGIKSLLGINASHVVDAQTLLSVIRLDLAKAALLGQDSKSKWLSQAKESLKRMRHQRCECGRVTTGKQSTYCRMCIPKSNVIARQVFGNEKSP